MYNKNHQRLQLSLNLFLLLLILIGDSSCSDTKKLPVKTNFISSFRAAVYNVSFYQQEEGSLVKQLSSKELIQVKNVAAVIQIQRPDILALMEFNYDPDGTGLDLFRANYLEISQNGNDTIHYPYAYAVPSNTGILSGYDLNQDGQITLPEDGYGFGRKPGQYAFAFLSKYPIKTSLIRSFQKFLWKEMPAPRFPISENGSSFYPLEIKEHFRLSSKNHIDIPIQLPNNKIIHVILAHPTPPVFDGPEDRNGTRNFDEIRLLADYISNAPYLRDDQNGKGGLEEGKHFIIMGDLNADPKDGDSIEHAILQLLNHNLVNNEVCNGNFIPKSNGGQEHNQRPNHIGDPAYDTSFFGLRTDYVIPSNNLDVVNTGVFWPASYESHHELIKDRAASDHLMVWVDINVEF